MSHQFEISSTPVSELSLDDLRTESYMLEDELIKIQIELSKRKAQAAIKVVNDKYPEWIGPAHSFMRRLMLRYVVVIRALPVEERLVSNLFGVSREEADRLYERIEQLNLEVEDLRSRLVSEHMDHG